MILSMLAAFMLIRGRFTDNADSIISIEERCNKMMKALKDDSTVRTLFETRSYIKRGGIIYGSILMLCEAYIRGELDPYLLHEAKSIYNESIEFCSDIEGVNETLPTEEHWKNFLVDLNREVELYEKRTKTKVDMTDYGSPEENCNRALKALRNNPTVRTLFEATKKINKGDQLNRNHLETAKGKYDTLIDVCGNMEGVNETLPTKEQAEQFLQDLDRERKIPRK